MLKKSSMKNSILDHYDEENEKMMLQPDKFDVSGW